jgi:hypothetical protein
MLNPMSTTLKNHPQQLINVTDYPDPNVTQITFRHAGLSPVEGINDPRDLRGVRPYRPCSI